MAARRRAADAVAELKQDGHSNRQLAVEPDPLNAAAHSGVLPPFDFIEVYRGVDCCFWSDPLDRAAVRFDRLVVDQRGARHGDR